MNKLKCKDYFIFKLRYYADKKILDKWHTTFSHVPKQHMERARLSNDFFWNLIEKITGKNKNEWYSTYMFDTNDCALEAMEETHGIYRWLLTEGYYTYFVPKQHTEIIEWVKLNIKSPYKILKRSSTGYVEFNKNHYQFRHNSKKRTEIFKHKIFIEQNTRKVLLEKKFIE